MMKLKRQINFLIKELKKPKLNQANILNQWHGS
jgi:hypothetical protein